MNRENTIVFNDGNPVTHVSEATYLGGQLTMNTSAITETQSRISACIPILRSLDTFWKKTKCTLTWKLHVYNAVITSKLVYGLETIQCTENQLQKLNVFQMKGLRNILGVPPTFMDRSWTNRKVLDTIFVGTKTHGKNITIIKLKRIALLGHIIRSDMNDPLKQVTYEHDDLNIFTPARTRVGRPRKK